MLGLGAVNNRWLKPRLQRAAEASETESAPLLKLRRTMILEVTLAALVLGATAVLVNLDPPRTAAPSADAFIQVRTAVQDPDVVVRPDQAKGAKLPPRSGPKPAGPLRDAEHPMG
jgi:hypothetical protein